MPPSKEAVKEELRNITTVNLIASTSNVLEKLLWALIAIFGTWFIYEVVVIQLGFWNDNPILITRQMVKLSDMPLPGLTFCHKGLQKYGAVERLANFIDSNKEVPEDALSIRNEFIEFQFKKIEDEFKGEDFCSWLVAWQVDERAYHPISRGKTPEEQESLKSDCNVSYFF